MIFFLSGYRKYGSLILEEYELEENNNENEEIFRNSIGILHGDLDNSVLSRF
jgi:hypothetical protein